MEEKVKQDSAQKNSNEFASFSNSLFLAFEFDSKFIITTINDKFSKLLQKLEISLEKNTNLFTLFPEENQVEFENAIKTKQRLFHNFQLTSEFQKISIKTEILFENDSSQFKVRGFCPEMENEPFFSVFTGIGSDLAITPEIHDITPDILYFYKIKTKNI
jgi:hypothetical protein